MIINRHNYEEFFLLYADDELNSLQRAEVELFVQQNPDMAAELEMLMHMKLEPEDDIVFPDKALLFKTADIEISINNYEEFFLLYIDGELEKPAAEKVEKFVLQHPKLQDEFTLLKQTVLQPEAITFADKSSLYRKEERKVGYMQFARLAAAAAIIGLVLAGWLFYSKSEGGTLVRPVVANTQKNKVVSPLIAPKQQTVTPQKQAQVVDDATASVAEVKGKGKTVTPKSIQKDNELNIQQSVSPAETGDNRDVAVNPKIDRPTDAPVASTTNADVSSMAAGINTDIVPTKPIIMLPSVVDNNVAVANTNGQKTAENPSGIKKGTELPQAQTIAYKEIDTNDDDRSMYVGSLELNKDKVRGFFKRAGRIFGGRPKKDTD